MRRPTIISQNAYVPFTTKRRDIYKRMRRKLLQNAVLKKSQKPFYRLFEFFVTRLLLAS